MGLALDILESFVHLTINCPAEKRDFVSSTSALGRAMVGLGLLGSVSSSTVFCNAEVPQKWPGMGMVSV